MASAMLNNQPSKSSIKPHAHRNHSATRNRFFRMTRLCTALQSKVHHLTHHLNELTSAIDLSNSHRLSVLQNCFPEKYAHGQKNAVIDLFSDELTVSCRSEAQFQSFLLQGLEAGLKGSNSPYRVVQVHHTVRKFSLPCRVCQATGCEHNFGINGTVGDLHIVSSGSPSAVSNQTPPITLPPNVAVIVEVKNTSSLSPAALAQGLLELELQLNLDVCHGRKVIPSGPPSLSPTNKGLENCSCTESQISVFVLWGPRSCAISSMDRRTSSRCLKTEQCVLTWVRSIQQLASQAAATSSACDSLVEQVEVSAQGYQNMVRYDPTSFVRHMIISSEAEVLGSVTWDSLCAGPRSERVNTQFSSNYEGVCLKINEHTETPKKSILESLDQQQVQNEQRRRRTRKVPRNAMNENPLICQRRTFCTPNTFTHNLPRWSLFACRFWKCLK